MTVTGRKTAVEIRELDADEFTQRLPQLLGIYADAMGYPPAVVPTRHATAIQHARLAGFAAFAAFSSAGLPIGFGYGYTTADGQWWNTQVRRALRADADGWLDRAFELCELHVLPDHQGHGLGRRLLQAVTSDLGNHAVVLSTPDGPTAARRLYERAGFLLLAQGFLFPTDRRPFTVMGRPGHPAPAFGAPTCGRE